MPPPKVEIIRSAAVAGAAADDDAFSTRREWSPGAEYRRRGEIVSDALVILPPTTMPSPPAEIVQIDHAAGQTSRSSSMRRRGLCPRRQCRCWWTRSCRVAMLGEKSRSLLMRRCRWPDYADDNGVLGSAEIMPALLTPPALVAIVSDPEGGQDAADDDADQQPLNRTGIANAAGEGRNRRPERRSRRRGFPYRRNGAGIAACRRRGRGRDQARYRALPPTTMPSLPARSVPVVVSTAAEGRDRQRGCCRFTLPPTTMPSFPAEIVPAY